MFLYTLFLYKKTCSWPNRNCITCHGFAAYRSVRKTHFIMTNTRFFIRTPKFWLSLDVLIFSANFSLRCSYWRSWILRSIKSKNYTWTGSTNITLENLKSLYYTFPVLWVRKTKMINFSLSVSTFLAFRLGMFL